MTGGVGGSKRTFLVASNPIPAHTLNVSKLVTGFVDAGHTVLWYAAERFAEYVHRCGAEHLPFPERAGQFEDTGGSELRRVRRLYRDQVVGRAPAQLAELGRLVGKREVDAVVSDTLMPAAGLFAASLDVPWVTFGDGPLLWWDEGTPPFGTGLPLMGGRAGRHRNRHVQAAIDRWLFAPVFETLDQLHTDVGAPPAASWRDAVMSSHLHLQGCTPSFEYPRDALPSHIRFIGALGPTRRVGQELPLLLTRPERSRRLALVTQGTLRPDLRELVLPACQALVRDGWDVLVAGVDDDTNWNRWPGRVHAMRSVDYVQSLEHADLFVTNGGYTGVTLALAAGVPVVQAGNSEEKPDIGARVRWSGVGASLRTRRPPVWLLRDTIRRVVGSPSRAASSHRLALESQQYDARRMGADLLTQLVTGALDVG